MDNQPLVVLLGDSLLVDSVEASLAGDPATAVVRLRSEAPEIAERLRAIRPDLVIFDLNAPAMQSLLPFVQAAPGVPLLGLDINGRVAVGLACTHYFTANREALKEVIASYLAPQPACAGNGGEH